MLEKQQQLPPLIFVYLGYKFPDYGYQSLNFSYSNSNLDIFLLTNSKYKKSSFKIPLQNIIDLDFYQQPIELNNHMLHLKEFRDGFWTKTLERFFVLEQFCSLYKIDDFFHAELDNLTFGIDILYNKISVSKLQGLFLPRESNKEMIASLMYCNNLNTLKLFNEFALNAVNLGYSEMQVLSFFQDRNDSIYTLPSTISHKDLNFNFDLSTEDINGIVDGNLYGLYLFGKDKRNVNGTIFNMFKHSRGGKINWSNQKYFVTNSDQKYAIFLKEDDKIFKFYNLHVHSKIIDKNIKRLDQITRKLNVGKSTLIALNLFGYFRLFYVYISSKIKNGYYKNLIL